MRLINSISVFFSVVFQPLFMPFIGVLLMFGLNSTLASIVPFETQSFVLIISLLLTIIAPGIMFLAFFKLGWVSDLNLTVRKERTLPTFIVLVLFLVFYYLVRNSEGISMTLVSILFGSTLGVLIANLVTFFWKISIHALGISGVVGSLFALFMATNEPFPLTFYVFIGIAISVGVSRLVLKRHTPMQVVMGTLLGFFSPYLAAYFEWYF